jgi:hypothetical protein
MTVFLPQPGEKLALLEKTNFVKTITSSNLLGMHVKASLVTVAHEEKTLFKALNLQAPPAGQVWTSYYFQGSTRLALRVQMGCPADRLTWYTC